MNKAVNKKIIGIFNQIVKLLEIRGKSRGVKAEEVAYKIKAYEKAIKSLENLDKNIPVIYKEKGINGIKEALGIGDKNAKKIEEYLKTGKMKDYEELNEETIIQQIVTYYFESKGLSLKELKNDARKRKIVYSRFVKPAKQLLELAGSIEKSKEAINKVANWAKSRNLDYTIETVFKKWLELDKLKPKEIIKKPFYRGNPMVWSETKKKWYVIEGDGNWLEFADKKDKMEWKIVK
jgi:DNA polymerase/3'-5' exonuclease PolX